MDEHDHKFEVYVPAGAELYWQGPTFDEHCLLTGFEITGGEGLLFSDLIVGVMSHCVARTIEGRFYQTPRAALAHLHRSNLKIIGSQYTYPCVRLHNPTDQPITGTLRPRILPVETLMSPPHTPPQLAPTQPGESPAKGKVPAQLPTKIFRMRASFERATGAYVYDAMLLFPTALVRAKSSLDFPIIVLTGSVHEIRSEGSTPILALTGIERISEVDLEVRRVDGSPCSTVRPTHIRSGENPDGYDGPPHEVIYTLTNSSDTGALVSPVGFVRALPKPDSRAR